MTNPLVRSVNELKQRIDYQRSICQLYKELLQKSIQLKKQSTLPKNNIISLELKVGLYVNFTKRYTNPYLITQALLKGIRLNELLEESISTKNWQPLQDFIELEHEEYWKWQQRRTSYLQNIEELKDKTIDNLRGTAKSLASSKRKSRKEEISPPTNELEFNQYTAKGFEKAKSHGQSLILRYLNRLQYDGKIPNPHLLPYTEETLVTSGDNYDQKHIIKGSTQKIINEAFDKEYIESIIIPGLEYEINNFEIEKLTKIINEKGPYQAVAKQTNAGIVSMPFIQTPFHDAKYRKKLAHLIRQQIKWFRIRKCWETTENLNEENLHPDGSYSIKGCRGFGDDELMKTRKYYEKLAEGEEIFELFCEIEKRRSKGEDTSEEIDLSEFDWCSELDIVSVYIESKLIDILKKSKEIDLSKHQTKLQDQFDKEYISKIKRFDELLNQLKRDNVFKHSEIVSPPNTESLKNNLPPLNKFPIEERFGRGKKLGDYLKANKFKSFEFGNELNKNINGIMAKLSKKF
ncbi:hypothetical protein KGF54_000409 [Candida jiufengensis]|uniref:uncharacterized protein n=1 Tax=Candida jiufengensis TaxID=497108 RepID=UPI002224F151|nr:uncharacterized protein KGF54_000409 [Candida jiufengensis]KAI5956792.1 hypothetical protein KGF54_000409 [Candida jiufengensis]